MATINNRGNITARCPDCNGALASFEWHQTGSQSALGVITTLKNPPNQAMDHVDYRLFRCAGCGRGALGVVEHYGQLYPSVKQELRSFYPEAKERLVLPKSVPEGIAKEFREGELCLEAGCLRAAAGMFRSVLDKTLRANGYKENERTNLKLQIDMAADDGVITEARKKRAHEDVRVLGNDVLHDEWHEIPAEDVEAARHYMQRILEDLYDDRESVLALLRAAKRFPDEHRQSPDDETK
jgi:Domain of unknown function (DUF4145)